MPCVVLIPQGHGAAKGAAHFATSNAVAFDAKRTGVRPGYERPRPAPGFDRLTANRTNYSLSMPGHKDEYRTQAADDARSLSRAVHGPAFKPRADAGHSFNIITGRPADPRATRIPCGPKVCAPPCLCLHLWLF